MELEALVRLVVSQVLQAIKEENRAYRALVLFTGGKTQYEAAFRQVKELAEKGWRLTFACSQGGEAIYGEELRRNFPESQFLTSPLNGSPLEIQRELDLVLIPVLSQNSLVKVALGLADTLPTLLIKMALLLGKPILAARNAGDARYFASQRGLANPSPGYLQMMDEHVVRLQSFGVRLVDVEDLSKAAREIVEGEEDPSVFPASLPRTNSRSTVSISKKIITREEIMAAAFQEQDILYAKGTMITPLAQDLAKKHGVRLLLQERE